MTTYTKEDWQSRIATHFQKLEQTGGSGHLKAGAIFLTRKYSGDLTPSNRESFLEAVKDYVEKGYVKQVSSSSPMGFDLEVTNEGINAFL